MMAFLWWFAGTRFAVLGVYDLQSIVKLCFVLFVHLRDRSLYDGVLLPDRNWCADLGLLSRIMCTFWLISHWCHRLAVFWSYYKRFQDQLDVLAVKFFTNHNQKSSFAVATTYQPRYHKTTQYLFPSFLL